MKRTLVALLLTLAAASAYAACFSQTVVTPNGVTVCTTCCYGGNCTTTCF